MEFGQGGAGAQSGWMVGNGRKTGCDDRRPINKESRAKAARHHRVYVQGLSSKLHHPEEQKKNPRADPRVLLCRSVTEPARCVGPGRPAGATLPDGLTIQQCESYSRVRLLFHLTQRP